MDTMSPRGCFSSLSRRLFSQEYDPTLNQPLLQTKSRKVKSRDDAYSEDNIIVFNDTHAPISTVPLISSLASAFTHVGWGGNRVSIGMDPSDYDVLRSRLEHPMDFLRLYRTMSRACNELSGIVTINTSPQTVNRKQIQKDLSREEVIINGHAYRSPDDLIHMKHSLLSYIDLFSRSPLASLAILRHLLTYFCRTEAGGDAFTIIRSLLPSSVLVTTVLTPNNPIIVSVESSAHCSIDLVTVLRITPDSPSSSILMLITKPLFAPISSFTDPEVDDRESFILVCQTRYSIFYCSGDVSSVELKRTVFFRCITNHQLATLRYPLDCFHPAERVPRPFDKIPVYYDIQCNQRRLHLTVEECRDREQRVVLQVLTVEKRKPIHPNIAPGHILVSIAGSPLQGEPYDVLIQRIRTTPRPCLLRMCYYP